MATAKSKMTLDKLAAMVQRGFEDASKRTNARFDSVDASLKALNQRVTALEKRLDVLEKSVSHRFQGVYDQIADLRTELRETLPSVSKVRRIERRVLVLERKVGVTPT